jgi:hypothetical protein
MNLGDRIRVKDVPSVDFVHRDKKGTVIADAAHGETVEVEFDAETAPHSFDTDDVEIISARVDVPR